MIKITTRYQIYYSDDRANIYERPIQIHFLSLEGTIYRYILLCILKTTLYYILTLYTNGYYTTCFTTTILTNLLDYHLLGYHLLGFLVWVLTLLVFDGVLTLLLLLAGKVMQCIQLFRQCTNCIFNYGVLVYSCNHFYMY